MVGSALLVLISVATQPGSPQTSDELQRFFRQDIGLSEDQITAIRSGQPVAKTMPSRTPDEVFLLARSTSMLLQNVTFSLRGISIAFAKFPPIWRWECSAIHPSFPI